MDDTGVSGVGGVRAVEGEGEYIPLQPQQLQLLRASMSDEEKEKESDHAVASGASTATAGTPASTVAAATTTTQTTAATALAVQPRLALFMDGTTARLEAIVRALLQEQAKVERVDELVFLLACVIGVRVWDGARVCACGISCKRVALRYTPTDAFSVCVGRPRHAQEGHAAATSRGGWVAVFVASPVRVSVLCASGDII